MNFIQKKREENSPFVQLFILILCAVFGLVVISAIGMGIIYLMYGREILANMNWMSGTDRHYLHAQRILISAQQIGLFLFPALFLAKIEGGKIDGFYGFKRPDPGLILTVFLIMAAALPLLEWVAVLNQKMVFPDALKGIERWMKAAEDQAMETTKALLKMESAGSFLINIGMIALLPAVAEELMFRGALQRALGRMYQNPHLAIWFSAFIFSAIHMQFYGFLPRLLLGAGFGYLYFWGGSLWYAMFAHFINNAYAVCAAWYMQKNNIPLSDTDKTMNIAWYGYVISAVLTFLLFRYFKKQAR